MRDALLDTLELEGHRAQAVSNGMEALEHLERGEPTCLILLDLMMPVMNGWEFRDAQLRDPRIASIPVVVLTAHGNAAVEAGRLTAAGYLTKPIDPPRLLRTVVRWCPLLA